MPNDREWHLNKSVPITLIFAILMQTAGMVWFISSMNERINVTEQQIIRHTSEISFLERSMQAQAVTLGRIDENLREIRRILSNLEGP